MIYALPFIAALTGWITNFIAVKMLFRPKEKKRILFFEVQGIFPKRKKSLAEKLGKVVSKELFSIEDVKNNLNKPEILEEVNVVIEEKIDTFLNEKLVASMPMLGMFMNGEVKGKIKDVLVTEFKDAIPELTGKLGDSLESNIDIEKTVYDKVVNFSSEKLEEILYSIMKKEFRFIELLGALLGFIIGLIQVALVKLS